MGLDVDKNAHADRMGLDAHRKKGCADACRDFSEVKQMFFIERNLVCFNNDTCII